MAHTEDSLVMTVPEVAKALSLSRNGAYQMAKNGQLPAIKVGKRVVVPRTQFEKLLNGEWHPKTNGK